MSASRLGALCLLGVGPGCAMLAVPQSEGRSGTLTTLDGAPVADAEVIVDTWSFWVGRQKGERPSTTARTDRDGRWAVPTRPSIHFVIAAPEGPRWEEEFTFRAVGQTDLHVRFPPRGEGQDDNAESTMRADGSGPPPVGAAVLPVAGVALGGGQVVSAHAGGMLVIGRDRVGVGVRAAAEVGVHGIGGDAGVLIVPARAMTPNLGIELHARVIRHGQSDPGPSVESGPEVGIDLVGYRLTVAWLGPGSDAGPGRRRWTLGVGFGYF